MQAKTPTAGTGSAQAMSELTGSMLYLVKKFGIVAVLQAVRQAYRMLEPDGPGHETLMYAQDHVEGQI